MSLSIGIVGLPNVGKSTLFNALLKRQMALAANYPFATIEPNIGIVDVPDERLQKLAKIVEAEEGSPTARIVPATVKFYDIAGLVKGASQGQGLGNKFLSHIKEVDAIVHVVRAFEDPNVVREGSIDPKTDLETINTELFLADLESIENRLAKKKKEPQVKGILESFKTKLEAGEYIDPESLADAEKQIFSELNLLTSKPKLYVHNISESELSKQSNMNTNNNQSNIIYLSAKIESELSVLEESDQKAYMQDLGIEKSGLDLVIQKGYALLNLQSFFTAGVKETRAWTIKKGAKAPQAAGKIHTDFEKGFIRAQVVSYSDLIQTGGFKKAQEAGLLRLEGKDYIVKDGDVIEFRFNV